MDSSPASANTHHSIWIRYPIIFVSIPTIDGQENVEFKLTDLSEGEASRLYP
jgi:hypothetical protein